MLQHLKKHIAAITIAGVVLGGGAIAYAADQPTGPKVGNTPSASAGAAANAAPNGKRAKGPRAGGGVLKRIVHGDLVIRGKNGFQNVTYDRGSVTSASSDSITLHRPDGKDVTYALNGSTKYKGIQNAGEIRTNQPAIVVSQEGAAIIVAQRNPKNTNGQENVPSSGNNGLGESVS
jgi:hypothetical protein